MESWERNSKPGFNTKVVETPKSSCEAFGSPSIFNLVPSEEKLVSVGLYNKFDYVTCKETQQVGFMLLPWGKKRKAATRGFIRLQCSSPIYLFFFFALCKMYLYSSVSHSHSGCGLYLWQHDCSCCTSCPERIFQFSGCRWSCREKYLVCFNSAVWLHVGVIFKTLRSFNIKAKVWEQKKTTLEDWNKNVLHYIQQNIKWYLYGFMCLSIFRI